MGAVLGIAAWWFLVRDDAAEAPILYSLVDFETYSSIGDLSGVADLVIVGTVDGVAGRDLDYGTDDAEEKQYHTGIPVVYYEVSVDETLKGSADASSIIVVRTDGDRVYNDDSTPLNPGHSVVLFLKKPRILPASRPTRTASSMCRSVWTTESST